MTPKQGLIAGAVGAAAIALALGLTIRAHAADLGGDCCADLDKRVADLEATTVRHANHKLTLTISGEISYSALYLDGITGSPNNDRLQIVQNPNEPLIVGFEATTTITKGTVIGAYLELSDSFGPSLVPSNNSDIFVRQEYVYLDNDGIGKFRIGLSRPASYGVQQDGTVAHTADVAPMLDLSSLFVGLTGITPLGFQINPDLAHPIANEFRWDSPMIGGVVYGSVSAQPGSMGLGLTPWSGAVRFFDTAGGFSVGAAGGYSDNGAGLKEYDASAGVHHTLSGLFLQGSYANVQSPILPTLNAWQLQGGWEQKVVPFGTTTIYGEYGQVQINGVSNNPYLWGFGLEQGVHSAADVYAGYRRYSANMPGTPDASVISAGVVVHF